VPDKRAGDWTNLDPVYVRGHESLGMMRNLYFFGKPEVKPAEVSRMILTVFAQWHPQAGC